MVDFARGIAHFLEAREQFVPQHGSSLTIFVMTVAEHKSAAPSSVHCFIVTVSDTRTLDDDVSGLTTTNMTVGTVAYSAPEQLMGEEIDGRADQYAWQPRPTTYLLDCSCFRTPIRRS